MRSKFMTCFSISALTLSLVTGCLAADQPTPRAGAAASNEPKPAGGDRHFPILIGGPAPANQPNPAGADTELVISSPAENADVTVYGSAFAQVEETRKVSLKAGHNRIQINGVAAKYRSDSLRVVSANGPGEFAYRSATYQPANLTTERLLAESVGKNVTARSLYGTQLREVTGKLQSVAGNSLVLEGANGKTELVSTVDVTLLETPNGLSNTPALVVEADVSKSGDYAIAFLYETEGLSWSAKHSLIFDEENSKVTSWETSVSLVNDTGTAFRNATMRLLSSANVEAADAAPGGVYAAAPAPQMLRVGGAAVENVGDQKTYTMPGAVDIAAGQTRQIPLFNANNVPVKRQYVVGTRTRYTASAKSDATIRLTVDNCEKNGLGKAIPSGVVKVYQYNSAKKLQLTGSVHLAEKAQDEIFDLNVGTSSDIKWEVKLASATPVAVIGNNQANPTPVAPRRGIAPPAPPVLLDPTDPPTVPSTPKEEWEDQTFEVTVYNFKKDKDVTVKVEINVPAKQQLKPQWKRPSATKAETELTVPKSGKTTVDYTIRTRVR